MPETTCKTIRTVSKQIEKVEAVPKNPRFKVGQWLEVYCGRVEGHEFCVRDMRFNHDTQEFEYLYPMYGWHAERQLVPGRERLDALVL